jgi:hypothetical protein
LSRRVESGGDFRVHVDEQVVFASVLFMSSFDMVIDPVFEELAKSCIDDIGQPLTRQQMEFFLVRQVIHKVWVLFSLLKHAINRYVFVLRAIYFHVFVRFDAYNLNKAAMFLTLLYARYKVFKEVRGHTVRMIGQIGLAVMFEEHETLSL